MKKITSTKTYASMMAHRSASNPNNYIGCPKAWANLKFKFPVFKSGKLPCVEKLVSIENLATKI